MSYCRWSSKNHMSDVYVYEDAMGGWTTQVAGNRRAMPPIPSLLGSKADSAVYRWSGACWSAEKFNVVYPSTAHKRAHRAWMAFACFWHDHIHLATLRLIPLRKLGLPHDGQRLNDPTPGACADRLEALRKLGYCVPQFAIDELRREEREGESPEPVLLVNLGDAQA